MLTGLNQNLDGDVFRDLVLLDDLAHEVEVRLRCGRKTYLDFLVAHLDQQVEHAVLALRTHWIDQRLVAVAQVHSAPLRSGDDLLVRPGAIRQLDILDLFGEAQVTVNRHRGAALLVPCGLVLTEWAVGSADLARCRNEGIVGRHVL